MLTNSYSNKSYFSIVLTMGQKGYVLHYMILNRLSIQIKCLPGTDIYCSKATPI